MATPNLHVVERFFRDVLNDENPASAAELLSADFVAHHPSLPGGRGGVAEVADLLRGFRTAFPDLRYGINDHIAADDRVVIRWTATGTHRGAFGKVPPTNLPVRVTGTDIFRLADGQIAETWVCSDQLGLMQQLGVIPS